MKLRLFLLLPILLIAALNTGCSRGVRNVNEAAKTYQNAQEKPVDLKSRDVKMPPLPDLNSKYWFNASPSIVEHLKGKVVLIDFWDYTCVNCIRTLPYIKEWYKRYEKDGLVIIGVHAPEFEFAKKRENVANAIEKFGLKYPIVMDNDFRIWDMFGNQYWPAKYLFDKNGILRYIHFGEGEYGNSEEMIQKLLKEINPNVKLPPLMEPIRATDMPGAVCYRTTPETYLGYDRGVIGNKEGYVHDQVVSYSQPASFDRDKFYLVGKWEIRPQYVHYAGEGSDGVLAIDYIAAEASLVVRPDLRAASGQKEHQPFKVYVYQDGKPVPKEDWSSDIRADSNGNTFISVDEPRMYYLIKNKEYGRHLLTLKPTSDEFAAYAFTFVTACETAPK